MPYDGNSNNEAVTSKNLLPGSILGTLYDIKVVVKYEVHAKTCHDGPGERTQNFLASTSVSLLHFQPISTTEFNKNIELIPTLSFTEKLKRLLTTLRIRAFLYPG